MLRKYRFSVPILLIIVLSLIFKLTTSTYASTGINQELSFEGKIANTSTGVNIANGNHNMEFNIYTGCTNNTGTGCTTVWTEDWLVHATQGVPFNGGTFQVNLGAIYSLSNIPIADWNTYPLYLSVEVGNTTDSGVNSCAGPTNFGTYCGGDGVMSPYILLTSTPYSLNSNELGGLTSSSFGQLATTTQTWSGQNIFQNASNSTTALEINNVAGTSILDANTSNNQISLGQSNINFTNLSPPGALTIGSYSGSTGPSGTYYYVVSFVTSNGQTNYGTASALATTTGTQNINLTNIPTGPTGIVTSRNIYRTKTPGVSTGPFYLVTTIANDTATTYTDATADGSLGANAPSINTTNGAGLLQVNGSSVLTIDQPSQNVAVGYLALTYNTSGAGNVAIGTGALYLNTTGSYNYALGTNALTANTTGSSNVAIGINDLEANVSGAGNIAIGDYTGENITTGNSNVLIGYNLSTPTAGTSNYLNIGNVLTGNTSTGQATFTSITNSAGAFQIQNSVGAPVVYVSTLGNNLLTYPGFETGSFTNDAAGWQAVSPGTIAQNTNLADVYNGLYSLKLTTTSSGGGAQTNAFTQTVAAGTYDVSFYVMPSTAINANLFTVTLDDTTTHSCTPASAVLSTAGFRRVNCSVTTTGNLTYLSIVQGAATAGIDYIDSVQINSGTSPSAYSIGSEQLRGPITAPVTFQSSTNSETAFEVMNASGTNLFNIDSLDNDIGIGTSGNPGALLSVGGTTGNFQVNSLGTVTIAAGQSYTGLGAVTLSSGASTALTLTGAAASTFSTTAGNITLQPAGSGTTANVDIGAGNGGSGSTTPDLLVLDDLSSGTPTEVNGAMYYNATTHTYLCGVAAAWESCAGQLYSNTAVGSTISGCLTTACGPAATASIPANYCQAGRTIHIIARGTYSDTSTAPTIQFGFYYGSSTTSSSDTLIGALSPASSETAISTTQPWSIDYTIICFSATSMSGAGTITIQTSTTSTTTNLMNQFLATTTTGLTTTTAKNLYLFPLIGTSSASNTIIASQYIVTGSN